MGVLVKAQGRITDLPVMAKSSLRRLTSSRCICQTLTMSEIRDPRGSHDERIHGEGVNRELTPKSPRRQGIYFGSLRLHRICWGPSAPLSCTFQF